jgi:glycosyltransferase involved in cell wall biosynthesis
VRIVLATDVIHRGGAEIFVLRLAKALTNAGHSVSLFILRSHQVDEALCAQFAPGVPVQSPRIPGARWWSKVDSLLFRSGIDFSFLRLFYAKSLIRCIRSKNVDIIHTHLFTTDIIGAVAAQATGVRAVTTIHGDYMMYDAQEHFRTISNIKYFGSKFRMILQTYSAVAVISDEQLQFFSRKMGELKTATPLFKIHNGFSATEPNPVITREELGIPDDALVFGMAARGIREKGWQELIEAFQSANLPGSYLVLVGEGEFLREIRAGVNDSRIIFVGAVNNVIDYVRVFDVCCLPTYFEGESLPTSIVEYLFCGKPVIATRKGEIPMMLRDGTSEACGRLIDLVDRATLIQCLRRELIALHGSAELRASFGRNAQKAVRSFSMDACVRSYEAIYLDSAPAGAVVSGTGTAHAAGAGA